MKKKTAKKKHRVLRGCLGIFLIVTAAFITFVLWPAADDSSVVLSDSFDNNDNNWSLGNYGSIKNGQLILSEGDVSVIPLNLQLKNGRISVDLSYISGNKESEYGIIFRDISDEKYSFFLIAPDGSLGAKLRGMEDSVYYRNSYIKADTPNLLTIELYENLIRVYINETLIAETYDSEPEEGSVSLYSSGESRVAFDNLEIINFDRRDGNIKGSVTIDGDLLGGAEVTAFQVIEPETLGVVEIAKAVTTDSGSYSFYLPDTSSYFIEAGTPDKKFKGDRYTDLQIPDSGLDLNISIETVQTEGGE